MVIALVKMVTLANFAIAKLEFTPVTLRRHTAIPVKEERQCVFANLICRQQTRRNVSVRNIYSWQFETSIK